MGSILLTDAVARCARQSEEIGAALIVAKAKNGQAKRFYEKHGFTALEAFRSRLLLPMRTAATALARQ